MGLWTWFQNPVKVDISKFDSNKTGRSRNSFCLVAFWTIYGLSQNTHLIMRNDMLDLKKKRLLLYSQEWLKCICPENYIDLELEKVAFFFFSYSWLVSCSCLELVGVVLLDKLVNFRKSYWLNFEVKFWTHSTNGPQVLLLIWFVMTLDCVRKKSKPGQFHHTYIRESDALFI